MHGPVYPWVVHPAGNEIRHATFSPSSAVGRPNGFSQLWASPKASLSAICHTGPNGPLGSGSADTDGADVSSGWLALGAGAWLTLTVGGGDVLPVPPPGPTTERPMPTAATAAEYRRRPPASQSHSPDASTLTGSGRREGASDSGGFRAGRASYWINRSAN